MKYKKAYKIEVALGIITGFIAIISLITVFWKKELSIVGLLLATVNVVLLFIYRNLIIKAVTESEQDKIDLQLVACAAQNAYPTIIHQNLTKNTIRVNSANEALKGIYRVNTIDELVDYAAGYMVGTLYKEKCLKLFTRNALLKKYNQGERQVSLVYEVKLDDEIHWVETTVNLVKGNDGEIYGISMSRMVDDTVKNTFELERAKHEADIANKAKTDFLASISHEIRTPINAVLGMNTMILRESKQDEVREYAKNIQNAGNTLLSIINDILDFSKIESGIMDINSAEYDLACLINDLVSMFKTRTEEKGLNFDVVINPVIPTKLYGDENRIKQVLINLLGNAVKYTNEGQVRFVVDYEKAGNKKIKLKVSVNDTGIGIKKEDLDVIFAPYDRVSENKNKNNEGIGIGLSITKTILKEMGSTLEVESVYGQGSTFSFDLEQEVLGSEIIGNSKNRIARAAKAAEKAELFHAPNAEILVIDDVEMNLVVAQCLLKRLEIDIDTCMSGCEGVKKASEKKYHIIFVDAMMPEMDGTETMNVIREQCEINKDTPIIVLTANAVIGARESYIDEGFDDYLAKPIDSAELENMIKMYLPDELIEEGNAGLSFGEVKYDPQTEAVGRIPGISIEKGIEAAGDEKLYLKISKMFWQTADDRIKMIEDYYRAEDIENYTIQVHALKSSARLLGAEDFSKKALQMELAGKNEDLETIWANTDFLLTEYRRIRDELRTVFDEERKDLPEISKEDLSRMLLEMDEALEVFDHDTAESIIEALDEYAIPEDFSETFGRLKVLLSEVDRDGMIKLIREYTGRVNNG